MKKILIGLGIALLSAALGSGYAFYSVKNMAKQNDFSIQNGSWIVNPSMDLKDPLQRARIAIGGLFALRESEVLYFVARKDDKGRTLESKYDYVLEGPAPKARYWSYTLYGQDYFLVKNEANKFGLNLDNIQFLDDDNPEMPQNVLKNHQVIISSKQKSKNWLPSGNEDQFYINLRMYNPSPEVYQNLEQVVLPTIKRVE